MSDTLRIADREFQSRLFVGTGKDRELWEEMARCHEASGAEVVYRGGQGGWTCLTGVALR